MKMIRWIVCGAVIIVPVAIGANALMSAHTLKQSPSSTSVQQASTQPTVGKGRYVAYDSIIVADARYATTILFFYSDDCQECKSFDGEIANQTIPDGAQIMRVEVDGHKELRQKYDVGTLPSFVRIKSDGEKLKVWDGYGRTKTVEAIIQNTA
jgi:hypothetical protein